MITSPLENSTGTPIEETVVSLSSFPTFLIVWANHLCEPKTPDSGQLFKRINISHSKEIDTQFYSDLLLNKSETEVIVF